MLLHHLFCCAIIKKHLSVVRPWGGDSPHKTAVSNVRTFYQLLSSDFVSWRGVSDGKYDVLTDAAFLFAKALDTGGIMKPQLNKKEVCS